MRKLLISLLAVAAITAQTTTTGPVPIDYRYNLTWTDPNPAGLVQSWLVYATNSVGSHSIASRTNTVPVLNVLNGQPAGTYSLYTTAIGVTGVEGDPGDQLLVIWPGGNGKPNGGHGPHVFR